ncbi:hypothetical protein E4T56_gene8218 [Termitomyces sp. T112]|nr:hypothetical protein E4T56_gene8218 [Termitomyces sp. T112]
MYHFDIDIYKYGVSTWISISTRCFVNSGQQCDISLARDLLKERQFLLTNKTPSVALRQATLFEVQIKIGS